MIDPIDDPLGHAQEQLRAWSSALEAIQRGQEYTIGGVRNGRTLTRANLKEVLDTVKYFKTEVRRLSDGHGGARALYVVTR